MLNAFSHCPFGGWIVVNDELTYLAGAHAMHTGEDESETNTNSLEVNDELPNSANVRGRLLTGKSDRVCH